ncbi:MAG TPA: OB-fold nucleic acid binding domain-containing protein [bacterium]|nr:OB-fold nucleic acid binding domain-containing protein [bacterium]
MYHLKDRVLSVALLLLVGVTVARADPSLSVRALIQDPEQFDGKIVTVTGTVNDYQERMSKAGNPYTTFRLADRAATVAVFAWNHQGLSNGDRVQVTGTFEKVKRVAGYTFGNEIEANRIEGLK